jgi:hypothetical protein
MRNAHRIFRRKTVGKRPRGRSSRRRIDNIRIDLREVGWEVVNWILLAHDMDQ